jgi:type IV pilus assembly protein PilY1
MSTRLSALRTKFATMAASALAVAMSIGNVQALTISDSPLFLTSAAEPLIMLTMSNDEQLYHKAYTDFDDVDGDNLIDIGYKDTINYSGYFDATKCYGYTSGVFVPQAEAAGTNKHHCSSVASGRWSGNFLNWVTMTRMDVLRQVLYGGHRSTDSATSTVLERAYVPPDNHAWIKLYSNNDLNEYTPYSKATYGSGITMCNVTPQDGSDVYSEKNVTTPRLRVAAGAWTDWAAQESWQCLWDAEQITITGNPAVPITVPTAQSPNGASAEKIDEFDVRISVCNSSLRGSEPCKQYPGGNYKPVGLLQDYGDADKLAIRFGLMTGSYSKRKSGGVLRKNVSRLVDLVTAANGEIDPSTGQFTATNGLIRSLDAMRISRFQYTNGVTGANGYGGGGLDNCPFNQNTWVDGNCSNWGNPMGEMYLETLRYFAGAAANGDFTANDATRVPGVATSVPGPLTTATWFNPYTTTTQAGGKAPHCAKPNIIAISTGVVSFDHDQYGGASSITGLNVNDETDAVGLSEGINGNSWYVGSLTGGAPGDVCTSRSVTALSAVSGICPEAAGLQGSFKIAGLASYAHKSTSSLQTIVAGNKKIPPVDTYAVALAPPTPAIKVKIGDSTVTIIPVGYNMRNSNAMSMVNFRVLRQDSTSGEFFMNYENAPAGADYDNDMKGFLTYTVSGSTIKIIMHQTGSSSGATQNMGYIIDGVSDANTHYLLSNNNLTITAPGNQDPNAGGTFTTDVATIDARCTAAGFALPALVSDQLCSYDKVQSATDTKVRYMRGIKTHTVGAASTGSLKSPLWYAAKWGGYKDANEDGVPQRAEWDAVPVGGDGNPDTYFPVTNASKLKEQLQAAFNEIIDRNASASSASVNSGSISSESRVYQAKFNSTGWTGQLLAFQIKPDGTLNSAFEWDAAAKMPAHASRDIFTLSSAGTAMEFKWANAIEDDAGRVSQLDPTTGSPQAEDILNYLRGDGTNEQAAGVGMFRKRASKLGDIISSSPLFVGAPPFRYRDNLESDSYFQFRDTNAGRTRVVYAGANDGMLHAFNAEPPDDKGTPDPADDTPSPNAGKEMFAYIPGAVFKNLNQLASPAYTHRYYVDGAPNMGDAFFGGDWHTVLVGGLNKGGQAIYALDITNPSSFGTGNVLWEFNDVGNGAVGDKGDKDLGYTFSRPAIVRLNNNKWAAIFGNGYNNSEDDGTGTTSTTGAAALYIVDVSDGTLIRKIPVPGGSTSNPNGLATPAAVDFNGDTNVDYVYAGDLLGNMWKFDLTGTSSSAWDVAYDSSGTPVPLYVAADAGGTLQPITSRPEVGRGPNGNGMVILFGTGKFLEEGVDKLATQTMQSFYGIYDPNSGTDAFTGRGALGAQTIDAEPTVTVEGKKFTLRVTSNAAPGTRGWYMDLVSPAPTGFLGERVIANSLLRNGRVIFTTLVPDVDPCGFGGDSWLMELDAITGARLTESPFDLDRNGKFDENDLEPGSDLPPSGMKSEVGITPEPGVLTDPVHGIEYKYMPGTTGEIQMIGENPGAGNVGRQSWRQIR